MFRFYLSFAIITSMVLLQPSKAAAGHPEAAKGVLDLRGEDISKGHVIPLSGEWEFYYNLMLFPNDFIKGDRSYDPYYGTVPAYWTDYRPEGKRLPGKGFGTYRLRILLPPGTKSRLGFSVPVFDSSFDLWLNGKLIGSNGIPGKTPETSRPEYKPEFKVFTPTSDTLELVINVSNHFHRRGGFWLPMKFGQFDSIQKSSATRWALSYAAVILLLGFALFFLIFFILYPKDRMILYFTIALFGLAMRPLFTSEYLINDLASVSWLLTVKMEYISLYMIVGGWLRFIRFLYPSVFFKRFATAITFLLFLSAVLILFTSPTVFSYSVFVCYTAIITTIVYALIKSVSGISKSNHIDIVYFLAFSILTWAAVNDITVAMGTSKETGYLLTYFVMGFVFIQSVLLLYKWITSYYEKEKLQAQLEYINRNLEEMVRERTSELLARNEEIERQNTMIADRNRQLSETIQLKNKVFSVISHDLRSPVVNILYMLNLLKEEEYKDKYDSFANSSIQYAQMVINLIENMLVWGRGQEDKIKYTPAMHDVASIVLTNMSIIKEGADRKEISVNFTQKGNSQAYVDRDLLDIIIRNLLSNALKYTNRGGRISILVKENGQGNNTLMLKICDNGVGIPADKIPKLFVTDEIITTLGTENEKGTGLGLKLCYELVKLNNCTITVESNSGEGSCFIIEMPASPAS